MGISKKLLQQMNDYYGCDYIVQETVPHNDIEEANKPEPGKTYALTGGRGTRCIANGNTWKESEVKDD